MTNNKPSYLLMWLEGPLQAWGFDSKFNRRSSLNFPTLSGLCGMILSAMGAEGEQRELLELLSKSDPLIFAYSHGSTTDHAPQPMLMDFHMVGSGYDDQDPWQTLHIPKTTEGKKAVGGGTKLTYRYYLQDMAFAAILTLPETLAGQVEQGLKWPVFDVFLGRKCCVPSHPVYQGRYECLDQASQKAHELAKQRTKHLIYKVKEGNHDGQVYTLNDVPVCFGVFKSYRDRQVTLIKHRPE